MFDWSKGSTGTRLQLVQLVKGSNQFKVQLGQGFNCFNLMFYLFVYHQPKLASTAEAELVRIIYYFIYVFICLKFIVYMFMYV